VEMVKNLQWAKNFHNFYIFKTARFQKFLADSNLQSRRRSWNFVTGHPRPTKSRLNLANTVIFLQTYPDWLKPDSSSSTFSCFHDFCNFKTAHFQELLEMGGSSFGSGNWKSLSACVSGAKSRLNLANTVFFVQTLLIGKVWKLAVPGTASEKKPILSVARVAPRELQSAQRGRVC